LRSSRYLRRRGRDDQRISPQAGHDHFGSARNGDAVRATRDVLGPLARRDDHDLAEYQRFDEVQVDYVRFPSDGDLRTSDFGRDYTA